ncbi:MAG TPA: hypothetical protein GX401_02910 [Clostridiales bacterium]|nr:hypothetical protein [Clostridiales bacterium]
MVNVTEKSISLVKLANITVGKLVIQKAIKKLFENVLCDLSPLFVTNSVVATIKKDKKIVNRNPHIALTLLTSVKIMLHGKTSIKNVYGYKYLQASRLLLCRLLTNKIDAININKAKQTAQEIEHNMVASCVYANQPQRNVVIKNTIFPVSV